MDTGHVLTTLEQLYLAHYKTESRILDKRGPDDTTRREEDNEDMMEDKQKATTAVEIARSEEYLSLALPMHPTLIIVTFVTLTEKVET